VIALVVTGALLFSGCASSPIEGLSSSDVPSFLNLRAASPRSLVDVAILGIPPLSPIPVGGNTWCKVAYGTVFVPPGETGEPLWGVGEPVTYAEVVSLAWQCGSESIAQMAFRLESRMGQKLDGIGDQAVLFAFEDTQDYPSTRFFAVSWRRGGVVGAVELAGPDTDNNISSHVIEQLAQSAIAKL